MNPSAPALHEQILASAVSLDPGALASVIEIAIGETGRRSRKERIREINTAIIEAAIELDRPDLTGRLHDISYEDFRTLLPDLISQYIGTRNDAWFDAINTVSASLARKGDQSEIQAIVCREVIEAGAARSDRHMIERGMSLFTQISFRKYQSGVFARISPYLIDWAVSQGDIEFLRSLYPMSDGIADISKKSIINAQLAAAIAAIGSAQGDIALFTEGIRIASGIKQKTRRQECIAAIINSTTPAPFFATIADFPRLATILSGVPEPTLNETIAAILTTILTTEKDRDAIQRNIGRLVAGIPSAEATVIAVLLHQSETDGDVWFFAQAMALQGKKNGSGPYPVHEFVRAAIAVFHSTGSTDALRQVIPAVVTTCSPATGSRILLRVVQVLLAADDRLPEAIQVFGQVTHEGERNSLYEECATDIFLHAISSGSVGLLQKTLTIRPGGLQWSGAIERAVGTICRQHAFPVIVSNADSLAAVMAFHPHHDQLVLDTITLLIHRGFLETANPDILIELTRSIGDKGIRERALSTIVIRVAKIGVTTRSRDLLQRAVGLSCLIEDARTRSLTLTAVIDEASVLAVSDGDIDLLRRMREWSSSLLSSDGEITASANIIEGMITYAADRRYPAALEEAYAIAREINDPSLRSEITQRISENFVRIGCLFTRDLSDRPDRDEYTNTFHLFERGLDLLAELDKGADQSLRIAHIIDIIIDVSADRFRLDLLPALMLFSLGIPQPFERDAMAARILSIIRGISELPDSTDPYESITGVLLQIPYVPDDVVMLNLVKKTADQIKDPFSRSFQLVRIAGLYIRAGGTAGAESLLDAVLDSAGAVTGEHHKVILLSECAGHYTAIDGEKAKTALGKAIAMLRSTGYDPEAAAARHLIGTLGRFSNICPNDSLIKIAEEIASRISNPADYAAALLQIFRMAATMPQVRSRLVAQMRQTAGSGMISVDGVSLLLDLSREMDGSGETEDLPDLLVQIHAMLSQVRVPFLADIFRSRLAGLYTSLYARSGNEDWLLRASEIVPEIGHDLLRVEAGSLHERLVSDLSPHYREIKERLEQMVTGQYSPVEVIGLENLVRSIQDRGLVARHFCMVAIFFNSTGKTRLARRYFDDAIREAGVIRPLSRRAYVLCDCAFVLAYSGCDAKSQDLMDLAIDAATGIRQYSERDDVFDGLAAAMRWMRQETAG